MYDLQNRLEGPASPNDRSNRPRLWQSFHGKEVTGQAHQFSTGQEEGAMDVGGWMGLGRREEAGIERAVRGVLTDVATAG